MMLHPGLMTSYFPGGCKVGKRKEKKLKKNLERSLVMKE
jgi:hypothetical protein